MYRLYGFTGSGNCWKPAVLMRQLGQPFEWVEVDILKGESRTPEFLARNANGRVPLLEVDGHYLAESNAMLCYLAEGSALYPADRWQRAKSLNGCSSSSTAMSPTSPRCVSGFTCCTSRRNGKRKSPRR